MMLYQKIKDDMKKAMKERNEDVRYATRMILGETPRLNKKAGELPTDQEVEGIIKRLIKSEIMVCEYSGQDECDNTYIQILNAYLPKMMSEGEVQQWIVDNINLGDFNPKIKAMGAIMKHLNGKADGAMVKKVLGDIESFLDRVEKI